MNFRRPCPVCSGLTGQNLAELNFAVFEDETLPGRLVLAACGTCGHCFYDGVLSASQVEEHYRKNQYYATSQTPGAGGETEADRRRRGLIIARLSPYLPPGFDGPVYDLGCGRGGLLRALKEAGFRKAVGVELLPDAVSSIRARGLAALEGSALRLPEAAEAPGLLIYSHVFEHLLSPAEALAEAGRKLTPGGLVYIEVPDAARYAAADPWRALYQEHLNHFDMAGLTRLLVNGGFEILALEPGLFQVAENRAEGIIWCVARPGRGAVSGRPALAPKAGAGAAALRSYLRESAAHPMMAALAALARAGRPLKIWGLSQMTLLLLGSSPLGRANIQGFIDGDPSKQARRLLGRAVESPLSLKGDRSDLLLAVPGQGEGMREVLKPLGFQGRLHTLD